MKSRDEDLRVALEVGKSPRRKQPSEAAATLSLLVNSGFFRSNAGIDFPHATLATRSFYQFAEDLAQSLRISQMGQVQNLITRRRRVGGSYFNSPDSGDLVQQREREPHILDAVQLDLVNRLEDDALLDD
jgi:hypothetical protein